MEEVKEGKAKLESLSGFKEGLFLGQPVQERDTLDQFLNHSCDPNLWMKDEVTIITMRDLQAGEELTIDYALFELDDKWVMPINCKCGTSICRKTITGQDWHLPTLHQKYLGHFIPYLNNQIKKLKEDQVSKNFLLNDF
jgi:hypothetical protein